MSFENKYDELEFWQVEFIEESANLMLGNSSYPVEDIIRTFGEMGFPLLFDQPGFYGKFCADTELRKDDIWDFMLDHD